MYVCKNTVTNNCAKHKNENNKKKIKIMYYTYVD